MLCRLTKRCIENHLAKGLALGQSKLAKGTCLSNDAHGCLINVLMYADRHGGQAPCCAGRTGAT